MSDERLEQLETKLAFQEALIQSLDEALGDQQQQMLDMKEQLKYLANQLKQVNDYAGESGSAEEPPPHY